jgi:hypothetical protein
MGSRVTFSRTGFPALRPAPQFSMSPLSGPAVARRATERAGNPAGQAGVMMTFSAELAAALENTSYASSI